MRLELTVGIDAVGPSIVEEISSLAIVELLFPATFIALHFTTPDKPAVTIFFYLFYLAVEPSTAA